VPQVFRYTSPATPVPASGTVTIEFTPRGSVDVVITLAGVSLKTTAGIIAGAATAQAYYNGNPLEGTSRGNNDSSDTRLIVHAGDVYAITWTGATPGVLAQLSLAGTQYPAGTAPWE